MYYVYVQQSENQVGVVRQLLSRWREKVFVLLFQQRLQQMEESRNNDEKKKEVNIIVVMP